MKEQAMKEQAMKEQAMKEQAKTYYLIERTRPHSPSSRILAELHLTREQVRALRASKDYLAQRDRFLFAEGTVRWQYGVTLAAWQAEQRQQRRAGSLPTSVHESKG